MARNRSLLVAANGELVVERDPDRASGRLLRQDGMDASYVDLADARHLEFDYMRWVRVVLRAFRARSVLHVGGAACTLARALLAEDGGSRHEVFEVDPAVLELARAHLGLRRQPGLRVRVADGRAALAHRARRAGPERPADAIVIDAFIGARVPPHLVSAEAFHMYANIAPLVVVNVVDNAARRDARAVASGIGEAYPHRGALSGGGRQSNVIIFGARVAPDYASLETAAAADPAPARLLREEVLDGGVAWRDQASIQQSPW